MNNEPVAFVTGANKFDPVMLNTVLKVGTPLYTHPVKELTDEEKWEVFTNLARSPDLRADMIRFADSILRKAQEK
jgi:hypothetical protein